MESLNGSPFFVLLPAWASMAFAIRREDGPPDTVTLRFRGRWEQYGTSDVSPDAIFADFAAGSAFIASPGMDSRHFRGRWAFSVREDGPLDTVTSRFRGRWEQYGASDVPPDAIYADFAASSAFIASPGMNSRHFRGRWAFSQREDGPPDTVTFHFRGRWEQCGASDVSPDAIFADFAAGSAFIVSPDMDSRHFCGR